MTARNHGIGRMQGIHGPPQTLSTLSMRSMPLIVKDVKESLRATASLPDSSGGSGRGRLGFSDQSTNQM
jgi:hypothetical protein